MDIGKISLKNNAPLIARIYVLAKNVLEDDSKFREFPDTHDVLEGWTHSVDLGSQGATDGQVVKLKVWVAAGNSCTAQQSFIYKNDSSKTALFTIVGTTLDNQIGLISVE